MCVYLASPLPRTSNEVGDAASLPFPIHYLYDIKHRVSMEMAAWLLGQDEKRIVYRGAWLTGRAAVTIAGRVLFSLAVREGTGVSLAPANPSVWAKAPCSPLSFRATTSAQHKAPQH